MSNVFAHRNMPALMSVLSHVRSHVFVRARRIFRAQQADVRVPVFGVWPATVISTNGFDRLQTGGLPGKIGLRLRPVGRRFVPSSNSYQAGTWRVQQYHPHPISRGGSAHQAGMCLAEAERRVASWGNTQLSWAAFGVERSIRPQRSVMRLRKE